MPSTSCVREPLNPNDALTKPVTAVFPLTSKISCGPFVPIPTLPPVKYEESFACMRVVIELLA